ncbi:hypothetical protein PMSM_28530 [Paenibacillus macquariensis subsp. macquariensis]|nr:hypothetical protein PMSM_28530 [Paenibacillus macquariensis subsp. macquariensis]
MAADPNRQEWWKLTDPWQEPVDSRFGRRMVGDYGGSISYETGIMIRTELAPGNPVAVVFLSTNVTLTASE